MINNINKGNIVLKCYRRGITNYQIREELYQGNRHVVIPCVMMVEGVHNGSGGPLLYTEDELSKFPAAWNGRPVSVRHPTDKEQNPVSCNDPRIIESQKIGQLFNTHFIDGKLKGEVWLDEQRTKQICPEVLAYIRTGERMDVSTGLFSDDEPTSGNWNGEQYVAIARNIRPDHLALLPGEQGACSWRDGCGIRSNRKEKNDVEIENLRSSSRTKSTLRYSGTSSTSWTAPSWNDFRSALGIEETSVADVSSTDRAKVAVHSLLGDASANTFAELVFFPVVEPSTGKLNERALRAVIGGRGAQANIPEAARRSARLAAYKLLNDEFDAGLEVPENLAEGADIPDAQKPVGPLRPAIPPESGLKALFNRVHSKLKQVFGEVKVQEMSYDDIIARLQAKVDSMDSPTAINYIKAVYEDHFIYEVRPGEQATGTEPKLYKRGYTTAEDGGIELDDVLTQVKVETDYVEVTAQVSHNSDNKGDEKMSEKKAGCCPEKVEQLIGNAATKFTEDDREWLQTLEEAQIDKLIPEEAAKTETKEAEATDNASSTNNTGSTDNSDGETRHVTGDSTPVTLKDLLQNADDGTKEKLDFGFKAYDAHRLKLVELICSQEGSKWTKEELKDVSMEILEKSASLIPPKANYQGNGGGDSVETNAGGEEPLIPLGFEYLVEEKK